MRTELSQRGLGEKGKSRDGVRAKDTVMWGEEPEVKGKW